MDFEEAFGGRAKTPSALYDLAPTAHPLDKGAVYVAKFKDGVDLDTVEWAAH